jgi:hypothetical protein
MKFTCRLVFYVLLALVFLPAPLVDAQDSLPDLNETLDEPSQQQQEESKAAGDSVALPRTFRNLSLGMELDALKSALQNDTLFYFRGDRDVSFLPVREQSLVETTGFSFIKRAFFQLFDGKLFLMAFTLDPRLIDHYSVYTSFVKKYGEPRFIDPKQAIWESGEIRLSIERPLTVKYLDKQVFDGIIADSGAAESMELYFREEFLRGF